MPIPRLMRNVAVVTMVFGAGLGNSQPYPQRTVRIVTAEAGSSNDFSARLIASGIAGFLGQQVITDNRAGQIIPADIVAKAPPDGHTLLLSSSTLWLAPFLQANVPYDPIKNFSPITLATTSPNILVVNTGLPVKSVKELVALARSKPGVINCASGPTGGSIHLAAELFRSMTGVNVVLIPYKGTAQALGAILGGEVQVMFPNAALASSHIKSGRLIALAVTSAKPSILVPGLPTAAASGLPGFESQAMFSLFAPSGTPAAIINRLNQEIVRVLNAADVKEKFFNAGAEVVGNSPSELAVIVKSEMIKWGKVIKDAGMHSE